MIRHLRPPLSCRQIDPSSAALQADRAALAGPAPAAPLDTDGVPVQVWRMDPTAQTTGPQASIRITIPA